MMKSSMSWCFCSGWAALDLELVKIIVSCNVWEASISNKRSSIKPCICLKLCFLKVFRIWVLKQVKFQSGERERKAYWQFKLKFLWNLLFIFSLTNWTILLQYLEELGLMKQVRCLSGASAGGMLAGLVAVGYNSYEIEQFLSDRIDRLFLGKPFLLSYFSLVS